MEAKQKQILLNALVAIEANPPDKYLGICPNIDLVTLYVEDVNDFAISSYFEEIYKKWPKYSRNRRFPVPSPYETSAAAEYEWRLKNGDLYSNGDMWSGKYGQLRKELLAFAIDYLRKELHA